ncbi:hypothetical protein Tco_1564131 [Tanacetum coccineum]
MENSKRRNITMQEKTNLSKTQGVSTPKEVKCMQRVLMPQVLMGSLRKSNQDQRSERVLEKPNEPPLPEGYTSRSGEGSMEHTFELMDIVPPTPYDLPLTGGYTPGSDKGRLKLKELMATCTNLSKHVLDLEKEKDVQVVEILKLKQRVKKLERKREDVYAATSRVSTTRALVSTARPIVSTVGPSTSAARTSTGILEDEMVTMADTLIAIRQTRTRPSYLPRPTSVVITDTKQEQRRLTTPPSSQPSDT